MAAAVHAQDPTSERRHVVLAVAIAGVGLGSALFHGTLLFSMQMLDELPMIYAMCVWWFCWFELEEAQVKRRWLAPVLVLLSLTATVVHTVGGFVEEFQIFFGIMVAVGFYHVCVFSTSPRATREAVVLSRFYIGSVLVALVLWIIDKELCAHLPVPNPQFHAWWHSLIAVSTYVSVHLVAFARGLSLDRHVRLEYFGLSSPPWLLVRTKNSPD